MYASRVKSIKIRDPAFCDRLNILIPSDTLSALVRHAPHGLFTSSPSLNFYDGLLEANQRQGPSIAALFLSTDMSSVMLRLGNPLRDTPVYIDQLATRSSCITRLDLMIDYLDLSKMSQSEARTALSSSLCGLVHLRELRMDGIDIMPAGLSNIGALPCLESLFLQASAGHFSDEVVGDLQQNKSFPSLTRLELDVEDLGTAGAVMKRIRSSRIKTLRVSSGVRCDILPSHSVRSLFSCIGTHPSHHVLQSLTLSCVRVRVACDLSDAFPPLFSLEALERLELTGWQLMILDNLTLDKMAHAWPRLTHLHLPAEPMYENSAAPKCSNTMTRATLVGLIPFAHGCPNLQSLIIPLDATISPSPDDPGPDPGVVRPERSALTYLQVGYTYPGHAVSVAGLLSAIFPHLERVFQLKYDEEEGRSSGWEHVDDLLWHFWVIRQQERHFAAGR